LHDDGHDGPWATASNHTWPALLAKQLNYEYRCYARPGSGNLEITNAVLDHIATNEPCVYVIGWSWPQRFSYKIASHTSPKWRSLLPGDASATEINKQYFMHLQHDYVDKLNHLIQIKTVLDQFKLNGCTKFIMTYMDYMITAPGSDPMSPGMDMLRAQCAPHLNSFNGLNFLEWSSANQYPIGRNGHPLEAAHQAAAEYALNHFLV